MKQQRRERAILGGVQGGCLHVKQEQERMVQEAIYLLIFVSISGGNFNTARDLISCKLL